MLCLLQLTFPMQLNLPNSSLKWVLVRFALKGDNQRNIRYQPIEAHVTIVRLLDHIDEESYHIDACGSHALNACRPQTPECLQGTTVTIAGYMQLTHRYLHPTNSRFAPVLNQAIGTPSQITIITSLTNITILSLLLYPIHLSGDHLKANASAELRMPFSVRVTMQNRLGWQLPFLQGRGICCPLCLHSRVTIGVWINRNNNTKNRMGVIHRYFIVFICLLDCNQISWLKI